MNFIIEFIVYYVMWIIIIFGSLIALSVILTLLGVGV